MEVPSYVQYITDNIMITKLHQFRVTETWSNLFYRVSNLLIDENIN